MSQCAYDNQAPVQMAAPAPVPVPVPSSSLTWMGWRLNSVRCVCNDYGVGDATLLFASDVLGGTKECTVPLERHMQANLQYFFTEVPAARICLTSTWRETDNLKLDVLVCSVGCARSRQQQGHRSHP